MTTTWLYARRVVGVPVAVGSFASDSRTLYIGGLKNTSSPNYFDVFSKQFGEFGEVEVRL